MFPALSHEFQFADSDSELEEISPETLLEPKVSVPKPRDEPKKIQKFDDDMDDDSDDSIWGNSDSESSSESDDDRQYASLREKFLKE